MFRASFVAILIAAGYYLYTKFTSEQRTEYSMQYSSSTGNFDGDSISKCIVCLSEFDTFSKQNVLSLPCKHKFHKNCIYQVFQTEGLNGKLCPLCRASVSEDFYQKFF